MKHFPSSAEDIFLPIMTFLCSICSTPQENMAKIFGRLDWRQLRLTVGSCCVFPAPIQRKLFYKYHCLSQSLSQSQSCLRRASDTKMMSDKLYSSVCLICVTSVSGGCADTRWRRGWASWNDGGKMQKALQRWLNSSLHHPITEKQSQNYGGVSQKSHSAPNQHCFQARHDTCHKNNNRICVFLWFFPE